MASLLTVVPGSRRPIRVDSTGVVVNIAVQGPDRSSFSKAGTNSSASRRKPQTTYRSPSLQFPADLCIEHSGQTIRTSAGLGPPPAVPNRCSHASPPTSTANVPVRIKYPMKPPLPIYHPLGRLALSLPELDPGMRPPSSLNPADDAMRGVASRPRRPAARVRDAADADADTGDNGTPLPVPVEAPALPEKPSPRKRRSGGQTNSRRRRREADDGDATYPAKRTRANRAPPVPASDSGSLGNGADAADADGTEEGVKAPERRSTRSRAAAQVKPPPIRRNSSASDRTQTSVSVSVAGGHPRKEDVDVTAGATARLSASSGEAEAAPVIQMAVDEPQMQGTLTESQSSKLGVDESPFQTATPISGGPLASSGPQKSPRDECVPGEEGGSRLPSC
ncbi:hypothetical protein EI94DRAFT_1713777 [Lactarius quietus]|nr:hypothetical protein EI94DRAFT_1713777 [Lactarius quietus]